MCTRRGPCSTKTGSVYVLEEPLTIEEQGMFMYLKSPLRYKNVCVPQEAIPEGGNTCEPAEALAVQAEMTFFTEEANAIQAGSAVCSGKGPCGTVRGEYLRT